VPSFSSLPSSSLESSWLVRVPRVGPVVATVATTLLVAAGCAAGGGGPGNAGVSASTVAEPAARPLVGDQVPDRLEIAPTAVVDVETDARSTVEAAVAASFARSTGGVTRRTRAGLNGISVEMVTRLVWDGGSGHTSQEFVVDDWYLSDPRVNEFVVSANRDLRGEARDLLGAELGDVMAAARRTVIELLDGVTLDPVGFGWWEGRSAGPVEASALRLLIGDGRLRSIARSVDVAGSTGSDTWEFAD